MNTTIENIPTVWHDQAGFPDDTALTATAVFAGADLTAHIENVLDDLAATESWESMALRSVARSTPHHPTLIPIPVAPPRPHAA